MSTINPRHAQLLEARGLDIELLARLGVASSPRGRDWIEIPYVDGGRVVNHKYRTVAGEKRFSQDRDAKRCWYNADVLRDATLADMPLVITEGEVDAWSVIQAGFPRTIAFPDGAPATPEQQEGERTAKYQFVVDALPLMREVREIILATDGDEPGIALQNDLAIRLGKQRCKWIEYPPPPHPTEPGRRLKDLNEVLVHYGEKGVVETLGRARWIKVDGLYRMSELPPIRHLDRYDIGIACLDRHYRIRLGDFAVITGVPNHGKTALANEIACRMAEHRAWTVAIASFEQRPQTDHRRNLRTFRNKKSAAYQTAAELAAADAWIDERFVFIVPNEDEEASLAWLMERCAAAATQYGAQLIIVDPWNELDHVRPPDMSLTEYTGFAIKQFRKLAWKYQVHVIVVAHPTKLARGKDGSLPIPSLYDISDSAHWANKADVGIVVYRQDQSRGLIRVQKVRYDDIGEPGDLHAIYLRDMARFEIIDPTATHEARLA